MGASNRLRLREVRAAYRLVGECLELGADSYAWRERWFEGTSELVGAVAAIGGEMEGFFHEPAYRILQMLYTGLDATGRRDHQRYMAEEGHSTIDQPLEAWVQAHDAVGTHSHEQLIAPDAWRCSALFNDFFRPTRIDDRMLSGSRYPPAEVGSPRTYNTITLYRALGDKPFSARQRRLVHLIHQELRRLIGSRLATARNPSPSELSPRLQQVLQCLLEGDSEKQVALRLGLSRTTVHDYVKAIYRYFHVRSRGELLARWIRWRHRTDPGQ